MGYVYVYLTRVSGRTGRPERHPDRSKVSNEEGGGHGPKVPMGPRVSGITYRPGPPNLIDPSPRREEERWDLLGGIPRFPGGSRVFL